MGFQFPLSSVLQVRVLAEEREEALLQKILMELSKADESLQSVNAALSLAHQNRHCGAGAAIIGLDLQALYHEVENLKREHLAIEEQIGKLEQLRDKQMIAYRAARQSREVLDQLLAHQRAEYEADWERREQRRQDDISSGRHVRRRASSRLSSSSASAKRTLEDSLAPPRS